VVPAYAPPGACGQVPAAAPGRSSNRSSPRLTTATVEPIGTRAVTASRTRAISRLYCSCRDADAAPRGGGPGPARGRALSPQRADLGLQAMQRRSKLRIAAAEVARDRLGDRPDLGLLPD
jgi:hypothetical protein